MSLALSTLLYEWRRYLAAVIALALAGVLMLALCAMFIGMLAVLTATIDKSRAEIIIMHGQVDVRSARAAAAERCPSACCR